MRLVRFLVCVLALAVQAPALAVGADERVCLEPSDPDSTSACQRWARHIGDDRERIVDLGRRLEAIGKFQAALRVYEIARSRHAGDTGVLKRFVAVQAVLRGQKLLSIETTTQSSEQIATSSPRAKSGDQQLLSHAERPSPQFGDGADCWQARWVDALHACQRSLERSPDDGALHERLADVYRSLGEPEKALFHYRKSVELVPTNNSAQRKQAALAELVGAKSEGHELAVNSKSSIPVIAAARTDINRSSVIRQLELLDDLKARKLMDNTEYQQRRERVLELAFSADNQKEENSYINVATASPNNLYRSVSKSIASGRYHALVIGNNRYRHFPELQTAVSDAKAVSELLKNRYGFSVKTILNTSRYDALKALSELRRTLTADDNLLIYYAGHGIIDEATGRGYWLPVEAEQNNIAHWISADDITDTLSGVAAKHAIVVADSCYSGSLLRNAGQTDLEQRGALLKRLAEKRSRTVLTSGGLEPVLDDGDGTHSVFARAFIDILAENVDLLEAGRLFSELRTRVVLNADQTPQYAPIRHAGHDGGDFIFVPR